MSSCREKEALKEDVALHMPVEALPTPAQPSTIAVILSVSFYIVTALIMVTLNKLVLNSVPAPLFFLLCQLFIAVLLLRAFAKLGYFTVPALRLEIVKNIAPLIIVNCTGLTFNTYCLQYVDASFYQVARGLVLPFTVLFSFLFLASKSSRQVLLSVAVVCLGFFCGVSADSVLKTSRLGITMGVASSVTTALHAIVIKRSFASVGSNTLELAYYTNFLSALALTPLLLVSGEMPTVMALCTGQLAGTRAFLWGTLLTGIFGFLICVAGFLSIKITSPVSHMVSTAFRGVIQTLLGIAVFGDIITHSRLTSIGLILAGSVLYTWAKSREVPTSSIRLESAPNSAPSSPRPAWLSDKEKDGLDFRTALPTIVESSSPPASVLGMDRSKQP